MNIVVRIAPMWETDNALYHFDEKERAEHLEGEKPELKYVILDKDFFIGTWQRKDMEGIHAVLDTKKEAREYVFALNKDAYTQKITNLVKEKEKELGVAVVDVEFDNKKNLHVLANRLSDDSYVVWTSYFTDEKEKSYVDFYNGEYDMNIEQGIKELERRSGREHSFQKKSEKESTEIFIGHSEVYFIENRDGWETDVEADYFSSEYYTEEAINMLEGRITEDGITPLSSDNGFVTVLTDEVLVYDKTNGIISYPEELSSENHHYDKKTWEVLNGFYDECLKHWEIEKEKSDSGVSEFALAKSPVELALQDIEFINRDPSVPKGQLLDVVTKKAWLQSKKEQRVKEKKTARKRVSGVEIAKMER